MAFVKEIPTETIQRIQSLEEIPNKIRFLVEGSPNMESKIATLKKFYPEVEIDTTQSNNFIVTDNKGKQFQLDNKKETNVGDFIDISKEITEIVGSMGGAAVGTATATPGVGTVVGAGAGMAAGAELFERVAQQYGAEMLRTNKEWAAQRATDFAFGSVGQAVAPLIVKGLKGAVTGFGKTGKATSERLANYIDAGVTPSLGQVTQKRGIQTVELLLGNIPGSSGIITNAALKAQNDLGKQSLKIAKQFIGKNLPADEVAVGKAITRGIKNGINASDGFVGRFQAKSGVLFGELDKYIKPDKGLRIDTTIKELSEIVNPAKGAENTSKAFKNQFLSDILEGLNKDLIKNGGTLPYSALKSVKGKIGNKLGSFNLVDDVSTKELKTIYGSISEDIKLSLKGNTKGLNALSRANKYYNTGLDRINDYLLPLTKIKNPDTIASLLINSGKEGATRLNAIKKSLNKDQYNIFLSNVMERMGRLQPGQALSGDLVETSGRFSSETFLTNFNKLSKQAQDSLFEGKGWTKGLKKDFKEIVSITDFIRQSGKTFKNPSGTADRLVGQGLFLSGGASFLTGNPAFMLAVPLVIGTASTTAKLFTNPSFIKWLAQGIRIGNNKGADAVIQHLGRLGVVMGNADSESRQFINEYLQMILGQEKKD
jgi:hypothetical protein